MDRIFGFLLLVTPVAIQGAADSWGYYDGHGIAPDQWGTYDATCNLNRQSPINFVTKDAAVEDLGEFMFTGYDIAPSNASFDVSNNGHTVSTHKSEDFDVYIEGGGLGARYNFYQFHTHWGSVNTQGSEHTIDGKKFAAEIHLVHLRSDLLTVEAALADPSGGAVLGVMVEVSEDDDSRLDEHVVSLGDVPYKGNETTTPAFRLDQLLPNDRTKFYRYEGSLTTPPCSEAIIWTVFEEPITMTQAQLDALRSLLSGEDDQSNPIEDNYRPVQMLNGRQVKVTFGGDASAAVRDVISYNLLIFTAISTFLWIR